MPIRFLRLENIFKEFFLQIVTIYKVLGNLTQKVGKLKYEDTICDLLYQFKYMFVGYTLKDQIEETISSFPVILNF